MEIIKLKLIAPEKLYTSYKDIVVTLKNCLDDDWAGDLRYASVIFIRHLIEYLKDLMDDEDYKEIYTELLKRLDDS